MPGPRPPEGARRLGLLTILLVLSLSASASAATVPAGFTDAQVTAVGSPTALAFTPDGRMLIATQPGKVRLHKGGELLATPALDLGSSVCFRGERGLLGIAVDPEFAVNHFIYAFATRTKSDGTCVNRVSRFVMAGDVAALSSEVVLFDNIHTDTSGAHAGGDLHFGNDGYLYVSVGDGYCDYARDSGCSSNNNASRDPHVALGKILRITRDGEVAPGNPYAASGARCSSAGRTTVGRQCQETFASGLRNPFRFAFDPNTTETRFFINDVGENHWEEIDEGKAGADYGWNVREGHCVRGSDSTAPRLGRITNPVFDYATTPPATRSPAAHSSPTGSGPSSTTGPTSTATTSAARSSASSRGSVVATRPSSSRRVWAPAARSRWHSARTTRPRRSTTPATPRAGRCAGSLIPRRSTGPPPPAERSPARGRCRSR